MVRQRTPGTSNLCRDARSVRPLCQRLQRCGFNGDGRTDRASLQPLHVGWFGDGRTDRATLQPLHVGWFGDGRTDRASLQPLHVGWFYNGRSTERPYSRYSSCCSTTDARPSVPTTVTCRMVLQRTLDRASLQPLHVEWFYNGRTDRASLQPLHVEWFYNGRTDRASLHPLHVGWFGDGRTDRAFLQPLHVTLDG